VRPLPRSYRENCLAITTSKPAVTHDAGCANPSKERGGNRRGHTAHTNNRRATVPIVLTRCTSLAFLRATRFGLCNLATAV